MTTLSEQLREVQSALSTLASIIRGAGFGIINEQNADKAPAMLPAMIEQAEAMESHFREVTKKDKAPPAPSKNELFKKLCKLGTPINMLIGAARSAEELHKHHDIPQAWEDGLLKQAEEAKQAWDGILAMIESLEAPPAPVVDDGYQAAVRLFKTVAPQCEPLSTVSGVVSQLDNFIAGNRPCHYCKELARRACHLLGRWLSGAGHEPPANLRQETLELLSPSNELVHDCPHLPAPLSPEDREGVVHILTYGIAAVIGTTPDGTKYNCCGDSAKSALSALEAAGFVVVKNG